MFSSQTGTCTYRGPGHLATPFVRSACFEPAYITAQPTTNERGCPHDSEVNRSLNCTRTYSMRGTCAYDGECSDIGGRCVNGKCAAFDSRNNVWRTEHSRVVGYAPRTYKSGSGKTCREQPLVVEDAAGHRKVVCPVLTAHNVQPQCATALNTVFQCERFSEHDPQKYNACKRMQHSIHYDIVTPNGQLIPFAFEMDGDGMEVGEVALRKVSSVCGSCHVYDDLAQ